MSSTTAHLTVGALAAQAGVNLQTIRYYERRGLLPRPPRTPSGYRAFPHDSVARVRFIKRAQALGFSLRDARELLDLRQRPSGACSPAQRRARATLADVEAKIRDLQSIRRQLRRLTRACAAHPRPDSCPILLALEQSMAKKGTS